MPNIISVAKLSKTYASGFEALTCIDLDIRRGEIFALLGPNGAGKTTRAPGAHDRRLRDGVERGVLSRGLCGGWCARCRIRA